FFCFDRAPIHQLNVIIGAHDIEDHRFQDIPPQYFRVSRVILHPNFRFSASHPDRYDVALIKLDSPVRFSDSVLPVCLPMEENLNFEGRKGVVTGWGKTDPALSNRYGTRLLQKVDVPIIDNEKCEIWHRTRGIDLRIFTEMMCAGYEDGQKDACGDSGGPLVININGRWTLAGITSAGFGCAQSRQPGIYHRVSHTVDWIRQTLQDEEEKENSNHII
ncbi:Group 3 mite allergen-like protein (serine protease), partial [Euroglyphus maynei]